MSDTTWTRQPLFNPKTIKKSTTITIREKVLLLLKRSHYGFEGGVMVRYKRMNGIAYVLDVTKPKAK